jgi:hypothetical protein
MKKQTYEIVPKGTNHVGWPQTIYHRPAAERLLAELGSGFEIKVSK